MPLCFVVAFIFGLIVYSRRTNFDIRRFLASLLLWFFVISIKEFIQSYFLFGDEGNILDVGYNTIGVTFGLVLSSRWFFGENSKKIVTIWSLAKFQNHMWHLYIVKCKDNTFYTGITTDLTRRLKEHNSRKKSRYTNPRTPVKLAYKETYLTRSQALKREAQIKTWSRPKKLALVYRDFKKPRESSKSRG
jgi:predicted GIY-YIG superfamily endonuclease